MTCSEDQHTLLPLVAAPGTAAQLCLLALLLSRRQDEAPPGQKGEPNQDPRTFRYHQETILLAASSPSFSPPKEMATWLNLLI